ncbi:acyltransferase family protein [Mesobacterium pallidum]|uniref:acyltransferase family protein n=1 Tax=Mesobacterium pallidum TaxID=2872037 RepID=UPI001EE3727D|nr:acyltransferase family protein [Mesobacterium pallidum]
MQYRAEIDGLRAVAVLPVILYHAGIAGFSGGFVGVDVFFVISGFLITSILVEQHRTGRFSFGDFYARRARRIFPALFLVLACCLPFAYLWLPPTELRDFAQSLIGVATFTSNVHFANNQDYFAPAAELSPLLHTWSLAVEEQFYILYPVLLLGLWRYARSHMRVAVAVLALASFGAALVTTARDPDESFFFLHTRAWELLLGAWVAMSRPAETRGRIAELASLAGLALIALSVVLYDDTVPFPSAYTLAPVAGTALVIWGAVPGTIGHRVLSWRPVVAVGLISYSAYLWHQPLFAFARHRALLHPSDQTMLALAVSALILAALTWKFVEQPFRSGAVAHRTGTRAVVVLTIGCLLGFIGLGQLASVTQGLPGRFAGNEAFQKASGAGLRSLDSHACHLRNIDAQTDSRLREILEACYDPGRTVYLIGDSHAIEVSAHLRRRLAERGETLITLVDPGCMPVPGLVRPDDSGTCLAFKALVYTATAPYPAPRVLMARWRLGLDGDRYDNGEGGVELGGAAQNVVADDPSADVYTYAAERLLELSQATPMVIVDQIPEAGWDVPRQLQKMAMSGVKNAPLSTSHARYRAANARVNSWLDALVSAPNVTRVRTAPLVCSETTGRCANEVDGVPLYRDTNHPSALLADSVAQAIVAHLP